MKTQPELTEFDELLDGLGALTRAELAELVASRIPAHDVPSFVVLASRLSIEALRFVSARTLLRERPREMRGG
jgi:hypothetical protein